MDAALLLACKAREHVQVLGDAQEVWMDLCHCPTLLEQGCVWGQQQCHGVTEVAAEGLASVQSGGIQVELCLYPFHALSPVLWSAG